MKKIFIFFLTLTTLYSCKNDSKSETSDAISKDLTLLTGDFVYYADAAVIQTQSDVYGVVIDEKMHELDNMVKTYKQTETDMVPVEIRGILIPKPENEEGWPFRIEIKEIIQVSKPDPNKKDVILESGK